jgi:hypothetical protein
MLIYIEDYLNRRRLSRAQPRPVLVAVGGSTAMLAGNECTSARPSARVHVLPLVAPCYEPPLPSAVELGGVYAEATLV